MLLTSSADPEWRHLAELSLADDAVPQPPPGVPAFPGAESSSQIVRGYANALYSLGRRYEIDAGPGRNRREALRCYLKAARLGNIMAFARLASRWLEGHGATRLPSADVPPDPQEAAVRSDATVQ